MQGFIINDVRLEQTWLDWSQKIIAVYNKSKQIPTSVVWLVITSIAHIKASATSAIAIKLHNNPIKYKIVRNPVPHIDSFMNGNKIPMSLQINSGWPHSQVRLDSIISATFATTVLCTRTNSLTA